MTFGQFIWDESTNTVELKDMGDTDGQRVRVITKGVDAFYSAGAGTKNVWLGTLRGSATNELTLADVATNGDFTIVLDDATNYPGAPMDVIVIYAPRSDASLQPSQTVYGNLGDSTWQTTDNDGVKYLGMSLI
jgi:hypothetical protein